jgi:putative endonuclease
MWFVYILRCSDNTFYTGCTSDLDDRLRRHSKKENTYTMDKLHVTLVYYSAFMDKYKACEFEKYLKSGSGKAFARKRFL